MSAIKRMRAFLFLMLICFLSCASAAIAQQISYIDIDNGLTNSNITSIYKDRAGFMWFGTVNGLNRYDGYDFKQFKNKINDSSTLPHNNITALSEDKAGNLWAGTSGGAAVLNTKTFKFSSVHYLEGIAGKLKVLDEQVTDLEADQQGNLLICSSKYGFLVHHAGASSARQVPFIIHHKKIFNYSAKDINIAGSKIWIIVNDTEIGLYDPKSCSISPVISATASIICSVTDARGDLWAGTNAGLLQINTRTKSVSKYNLNYPELSDIRILDISFDEYGKLWIATDGEGAAIADTSLHSVLRLVNKQNAQVLPSNLTSKIFIDSHARRWIGTRLGIQVIDNNKHNFKVLKHEPYNTSSLSNNYVLSVLEDGSNLWIGTDGGGISVWNKELDTFRHYVHQPENKHSLPHNRVLSLLRDENIIYTAAYGSGVSTFNKQSRKFENVPFQQPDKSPKYVMCLYKDSNKDIWAGCYRGKWARNLKRGLFKLDRNSGRFTESRLAAEPEVFCMAEDRRNNLWLGTLTGVTRINKKTSKVTRFNLNALVRALYFSKNGQVWIGTYGKGLLVYTPGRKKFRRYSEETGLPSNIIAGIEEDNFGGLWISTFNGLTRMDLHTGKCQYFGPEDNLQSKQFNLGASAKLRTGEIIFGGVKGLNIIDPKVLPVSKSGVFPPLAITDFKILHSDTHYASFLKDTSGIYHPGRVILPYEKAMFSLAYAALEYSFPEKIEYAYYLKGWDKAWNYVKNQRTVTYTKLNEGNYTLLIKSTNAFGHWNKKVLELNIRVLPPWYRSWPAFGIYGLLALSIIGGFLYYQKKEVRLRYEVKLEKELSERKVSFFTNIAHELRSPLTLIINPIKDLLANDGKNLNLVDISSVYRNTQRLLSLADQLLLFKSAENEISDLKPSRIDLKEVCSEVFECFNNQVKAKSLHYMFECREESLEVFADREKIEIILFNLLFNAIKYTPAGKEVRLMVYSRQTEAVIIIRDTGQGIPEGTGEKLFDKFTRFEEQGKGAKNTGFGIGLYISKKLADKMQAVLSYRSKINEGTEFRLVLPKRTALLTQQYPYRPAKEKPGLISELITEPAFTVQEKDNSKVTEIKRIAGLDSSRAKILVIDDDDELREYIKQLLTPDYAVYETNSGETGLELIAETEPDIILCDVVMRNMSGVELCTRIKESAELSHIPVILLTGTSSPEVKLQGIECGADDYITKPFEKGLLLARIKSILKGRDALRQYFFSEVTLQHHSIKISDEYRVFFKKCVEIIGASLQDPDFNVKVFAKEIGMSKSSLFRKVKSISGLSINEFIRYMRLKKAAELMIETDIQVKEVAMEVGFKDPRYFRDQFSKLFLLTPSGYIKKYRKNFSQGNGSGGKLK